MSTHKTKRAGVILFIGLLLFILAWGAWKSLAGQSLEDWIKQKDEPIVQRLNRAADLFEGKRYGEAAVEFRSAYDLAEATDVLATTKWQKRMENIPTPRKFYSDPTGSRSRSGLSYFKNRMGEAGYGLASSIYRRVLDKYRHKLELSASGDGPRFTPPASELQPALAAIDETLKVTPLSENLRLLKSDILILSGAYADAINILNEVLLLNLDSAEAYNQLGLIYSSPLYMNSEEYEVYREKAVAMFEKAVLLKDGSGRYLADPQYNLGMYYAIPPADKGENAMPSKVDAQKAIKHLQRYIELIGKDTKNVQQAKQVIDRLEKIK